MRMSVLQERLAYLEIKEKGSMTSVIRPLHTALSSTFAQPRAAAMAPLRRGLPSVALAVLLIVAAVAAPAAYAGGPASTIAVNTTTDEYNVVANANCSLREAVQSANNNANFGGCILSGTQPFTINLGAGTFQLTIARANNDNNATGDLDILANNTVIAGAGAASTTIQQTAGDRVIDINPPGTTPASRGASPTGNLRAAASATAPLVAAALSRRLGTAWAYLR